MLMLAMCVMLLVFIIIIYLPFVHAIMNQCWHVYYVFFFFFHFYFFKRFIHVSSWSCAGLYFMLFCLSFQFYFYIFYLPSLIDSSMYYVTLLYHSNFMLRMLHVVNNQYWYDRCVTFLLTFIFFLFTFLSCHYDLISFWVYVLLLYPWYLFLHLYGYINNDW
jgi:hypothetical protein